MKKLVTISVLLLSFPLIGQEQVTQLLTLNQKNALMNKMDSLIYEFERSHLIRSRRNRERYKTNFIKLFRDKSQSIPSDFSPDFKPDLKSYCIVHEPIGNYYDKHVDGKLSYQLFSSDISTALYTSNLRLENSEGKTTISVQKKYAMDYAGKNWNFDSKVNIDVDFLVQGVDISNLRINNISVENIKSSYQKQLKEFPEFYFGILFGGITPDLPGNLEGRIQASQVDKQGFAINSGLYLYSKSIKSKMKIESRDLANFAIGLDLTFFAGKWSISSDTVSFVDLDPDEEEYHKIIYGSNIEDSYSIVQVGIPVRISVPIFSSKTTNVVVFGQVKPNFNFHSKFKGSGTFTYRGFYPQYNALLTNLPEYGFEEEVPAEGNYNTNLPDFSMNYETGLKITRSNKGLIISPEVFYSLQRFMRPTSTANQLSRQKDNYNGIGGLAESMTMRNIGFRFSLKLPTEKVIYAIWNRDCN